MTSNSPGTGPNLSAFRAELSALSGPLPPTAVQLLNAPANTTAYEYQTASFVVTAYGSGPLSYQWYFGTNVLILIRFQDEPNSGRVLAWQDHAGLIHSLLSGRN